MFNISSQEGPVDVSKLYIVVIVKLCLEAWQDKERVENLNAHKKTYNWCHIVIRCIFKTFTVVNIVNTRFRYVSKKTEKLKYCLNKQIQKQRSPNGLWNETVEDRWSIEAICTGVYRNTQHMLNVSVFFTRCVYCIIVGSRFQPKGTCERCRLQIAFTHILGMQMWCT